MAELEKLLQFKIPEATEIKAYAVRLPDGKIVVRSEDELTEPQPAPAAQAPVATA